MENSAKSMLKFFDIFHNPSNESSEAEALELLSQLPNPAEVRAEDQDKFTLLHHACYKGWYQVSKILIEKCNYDPTGYWKGAGSIRQACLGGNLDLVRYLILDKGCDPNSVTNEERTPLHNAALGGHLGIAKFLIEYCNVIPDIKDSSDVTPLHLACQRGHLAVAEYLIREQHCDPSCKTKCGQTPLHSACLMGHLAIAKYLIEEGHIDPYIRDQDGCTSLHLACLKGHLTIAKYLIEEQHGNQFCNESQNGGWTPLHAACDGGHLNVVEYLIEEHHFNPYIKSEDYQTPLHSACLEGHLDVVQYLTVKQACDPTCRNKDGWTPLHFACQQGHLHVAKFLIEILESNPNCKNEEGLTPLHLACFNGHINLMIYLIEEQYCDPASISKNGQTPLHLACIKGNLEAADYLINKWQCDPTIKDTSGSTAFTLALKENRQNIVSLIIESRYKEDIQYGSRYLVHSASIRGDSEIVKFLVNKQNCHPEFRDVEGLTSLHLASKYGHIDVVKYLITALNCSVFCQAKDGSFPSSLAIQNNHTNVAIFLLQREYDVSDNLLIHSACKAGHIINVRYLVKHCNPYAKDGNGFVPLHIACENGYLEIVKFLVKEANCDPMYMTSNSWTPLHSASQHGRLNIIKYLIEEEQCDPNCITLNGITPLHLACRYQHFNVAVYLVNECISNALVSLPCYRDSLMDETLRSGNDDILFFLISNGLQFTSKYIQINSCTSLVQPALKIFVLGNAMSGKSTLIKAIMSNLVQGGWFNKIFNPKVTGVEPHTAGIVPYHAQSQSCGRLILYDFAGQYEHYSSSHAAVLENLKCTKDDFAFIVVDISKTKKQLVKELHYWDSFLSNQFGQELSHKPQIIVIGSHLDVVKSQGKITLTQALREVPHLNNYVTLDCTRKSSQGLTKISSYMSIHSKRLNQQFSVTAQIHYLNRLLQETFKDRIACQLHEIMESVARVENSMLRKHNLLSSNSIKLSEQLSKLCMHGEIFYFEHSEDITLSWIIFKKEVLLSEVNGLIFAPKESKSENANFGSTGVVALSKIARLFPQYDIHMLISFMSHLDFCHQLQEADISAMSVNHHEAQYLKQEAYYFFPALVNTDYPAETCETIIENHYNCGWYLHCRGLETIFFTSRFLHVLLLRLAFTFALPAANSPIEETSLAVEHRQCNIWKNGIHWLNMDGVETIVQVIEQNTAVVLLMGCLEGSEVKCIQLRSAVIETILSTKEKYSVAVDAKESFILNPDQLIVNPLTEVRSLYTFPVHSLKMAISERREVLTNKIGSYQKMVKVDSLLYFEPYTCLSKELITKLLDERYQNIEATDEFFRECAKVSHPKIAILKKILLKPEHDSEYNAAIKERVDQFSDDPTHKCYHVFTTWQKFTLNPTYRGLREALDSFSVFRGRHPLP